MKWLLILLALVACRSEDAAYPRQMAPIPDKVVQAARITGTTGCERTPGPPDGLIDQAVLEAYIAELSARLEICADKVDRLNDRIKRSRRK
jgi:hypothetical protein